jgi:hypothetical protein
LARKKLNLQDSLKDIIKRQQEAQEAFEGKSNRREQLFRSDEEREEDEARIASGDFYSWGKDETEESEESEESEEPEATSAPILPPPELIYPITQSSKFGAASRYDLTVTRKDKYSDYHGQAASKQSTRVAAAQWIPTFDIDLDEQGNQTYSGFGDILIGFARPSRAQSSGYGALYYWVGQNEAIWENFKTAESFGKQVEVLGDGEQFDPRRITVYTEEHSAHDEMDEGAEDTVRWIWTIGFTTNRDAAEFEALKAARKAEVAARAAERARTTKGKKTTE